MGAVFDLLRSMAHVRLVEMLQAWGISSQPAVKRTRSDVEEEQELDVKPVFINIDSEEEEEQVNSN